LARRLEAPINLTLFGYLDRLITLDKLILVKRGFAMPVSIESFGIDQLSVGDRLDLIEKIWDSLPEQISPQDVPEWHLTELDKRRAKAEREPGVGKPFREVIARLEVGQ
jgi:putative addiction module component (TIGR02574 family)